MDHFLNDADNNLKVPLLNLVLNEKLRKTLRNNDNEILFTIKFKIKLEKTFKFYILG